MTQVRQQDDWPENYAAEFWSAYPRKVGKKDALRALDKARSSGVRWGKIFPAVLAYAFWLDDTEHWRPEAKHPATWLNKGCWDDELPVGRPLDSGRGPVNGFAALHRELREA